MRFHQNLRLASSAMAENRSALSRRLMCAASELRSEHTWMKALRSKIGAEACYLILPSTNSTCLRAIGSYFFSLSFSVFVRGFFLVT